MSYRLHSFKDNTRNILRLRDYVYDPTNPDVIGFRSDSSQWNSVPYSERRWLERFMMNKTPSILFTENQFSNTALIDKLFLEIQTSIPWIQKDRAIVVAYNDLKGFTSYSQRYNYFRYFIDHYITERIKKKYLNVPPRYPVANEEQAKIDSEQNFIMWYSDYNTPKANETLSWLAGIPIIGGILNFFLPGIGNVIGASTSMLSGETLGAYPNGIYMPNFAKENNTTFGGSGNITTILLIGAGIFLLFGQKKHRGRNA
jgi:hypothetical protein